MNLIESTTIYNDYVAFPADSIKFVFGYAHNNSCLLIYTTNGEKLIVHETTKSLREKIEAGKEPKPCKWTFADHESDSGDYETACGHGFSFTHDGIKENDFAFCPFCGGRIVEEATP